ncbi:hypothetical protein D3C81_1762470 [compost metagenome]
MGFDPDFDLTVHQHRFYLGFVLENLQRNPRRPVVPAQRQNSPFDFVPKKQYELGIVGIHPTQHPVDIKNGRSADGSRLGSLILR